MRKDSEIDMQQKQNRGFFFYKREKNEVNETMKRKTKTAEKLQTN